MRAAVMGYNGIAMGKAHFHSINRTQQFLRSLDSLFAEAVRGSADVQHMLQSTLEAAVRVVEGRRGFLAIVNHETGELEVVCTTGEGWTEERKRLRLNLGQEGQRGITGYVALTGMPYVTGDTAHDPHHLRFFEDARSEIAVPILGAHGQARGVINIDSPENDAFDEDDIAHLAPLAHAAAVRMVIEGFRARETALVAIGQDLASTVDVDALVRKVVDLAADALEFEDCSVFLLDEQTEHLVLKATRGSLALQVGKAVYHLGEGLTGWVALHGEPVRLADPVADPRWKGLFTEFPAAELGAFMAVPIESRNRVLGVIRVLRRKVRTAWFTNRFTEADERVLTTIGSQVGAAIDNARSFKRMIRAERMAAWGELSARSAHMIGNRAFALRGDLNELIHVVDQLPQCPEKEQLTNIAHSMEKGLARLEEILREFRDYVMATQVTPTPCDVAAVLREAVEETLPKRSNVKLVLSIAEDLPVIACDAVRLKRAFGELIENAVTFQPEGGELKVCACKVDPEERGDHGLPHSRQYIRIEFADRGPGVPTDLKRLIFRPFYTSRVKGMGLGLSIVQGIVEAHQGIIKEVGVPGEGARFVIYLPVTEHQPQQQVQSA